MQQPKPKPSILSATELRPLVEEMIQDPRLVGLAKFITKVAFFWSEEIDTACAGHGFIFFNKKFFYSMDQEGQLTVLVHEIHHLSLRHLERGKMCIPHLHNIAADHVINLELKDQGFSFDGIPVTPCCDPKYKGMSTEQVYNILKKEPEPPKPQKGQVSSDQIEEMIREALEPGQTLEDQIEKAEEDVKTLEATIGTKPGNVIINLHRTPVNVIIKDAKYSEIFGKYLIDPINSRKRSFMRPSRRQQGSNTPLRLPGRLKKDAPDNRLTHLVYALDVSGSITPKQAQQFHDSVRTIKELLNPSELTVLFFDTTIRLKRTFTDQEPYGNIEVTAGGGTCLRGVWSEAKKIKPEALVIFTDMELKVLSEPDFDVIWMLPGLVRKSLYAPYGKMYTLPK